MSLLSLTSCPQNRFHCHARLPLQPLYGEILRSGRSLPQQARVATFVCNAITVNVKREDLTNSVMLEQGQFDGRVGGAEK